MSKELLYLLCPVLNVDNPIGVCFAERPSGEEVHVEYLKICI